MFKNKRARKKALKELKDVYFNFKKWWSWVLWIGLVIGGIIGYITDPTMQSIFGEVAGLIVGAIILFIATYIEES